MYRGYCTSEKCQNFKRIVSVTRHYYKAKDIDIQIIVPSRWRKLLGFKQGAGIKRQDLKRQCFEWVKKNLGLEKSEDEVEAIGIGAAVLKLFQCK